MSNAASKLMWVGRATVFMVGLSVVLALVLGVATTALGATGASFILGKPNSAESPTSLVSTLTKATQSALSVTNKSGGPALSLGVLSGKAPIKVSATAGTATNLSADKLDGKDSSEFLGKSEKAADATHADSADHATTADSATSANSAGDANTLDGKDSTAFLAADGKAADSETLDGKNSTDFADANHNHDSSYIQQSPTSAENASININGIMRTSGMLRTGSETGTLQGPGYGLNTYEGLVVRRAVSSEWSAGSVIARTDGFTLERDGTLGGLRLAWNTGGGGAISCTGLTQTGTVVGKYSHIASTAASPLQVFSDSQDVVYYSCSFGLRGEVGHVTEVTMTRIAGSKAWVGTLTSSYNQ